MTTTKPPCPICKDRLLDLLAKKESKKK